ncbi:19_t:CDS:2, partial [Funneliformis geosporum]
DMSNDKGLLECLPIYSFLFLNEKGSSLYNAYDRNDISEVYGLPGIHECINGQKSLKAMIDIDASQEDMKIADVKTQKNIFNGLIITTSSDISKYSYHILYISAFLIDHHELKAFTELVYTITGKNSASLSIENYLVKILTFVLLVRQKKVQLPSSLGLEVRPQMLSEEKNNNPLKIIQGSDEPEEVFECNSSIAEKIQKENKNSSQLSHKAKQTSLLPFENHKSASLICHLRKDLQGIVHALKTEFPELGIKEYHGKSDLIEKAQDFSNVGIVVSIIEFVPKPEDTTILLSQIVKTAELLENKPKKTLEEMRSLDQYHIMDCYGVLPELLTEDHLKI